MLCAVLSKRNIRQDIHIIPRKDVLKSYYRFRVKGGEISCDISAQSQMFEAVRIQRL